MGNDHAGKRVFNNTANVQIPSSAEQGNNIFRSGVSSAKRVQSTVNSGIKIKLKGLYKN